MRDSNSLRLRLVVRRHALPEVRVVFAVQLDTDPTIANLVEQVNEIIPLESNDWGLEDYVVELRDSNGHGFDCLHFQQVSAILKNDEEVLIRPLDTGDRRKRRLSGRYQISTDGKRLIDGVAFGRPRLKIPRDRPAIDIPPLKRRRITYDAEEADREDEDEEPRLLLTEHGEGERAGRRVGIRARFDDIGGDGFDGDEEEEDGDFIDEDADRDTDDGEGDLNVDEDLDDFDLDDELRDLQKDNEQSQDGEIVELGRLDDRSATLGQATGLDLETLDKISALRAAFPTIPFDACEKALALHKGSTESAYFRLQTQHQPVMSLDAMLGHANPAVSKTNATEDDAPDDSEAESVASLVKHYDQHGFPSGSILDGTAAAQMVEAMRKSGQVVKPPVYTKFDDDETDQADQVPPRSEEESVSEDDSDGYNDSESDSGPEVASSKMPKGSGGARLFSATGDPRSNHDDSESEDESGTESDSSDDDRSSDSDGGSDSGDSSGSDAGDESSELDDTDGANDRLDGDPDKDSDVDSSGDSSASSGESDEADSSSDDDSSDGGSVDATTKSSSTRAKTITTTRSSTLQDSLAQRPPADTPRGTGGMAETQTPVPPGQGKTATQKRNARRRAARMAQSAAGRGKQSPPPGGLGVLAAAESQELLDSIAAKKAALLERLNSVQNVLSQQVKDAPSQGKARDCTPPPQAPAANHRVPDAPDYQAHEPVQQLEEEPPVQEGLEAWRDKIVYRAVECCQEGVELSEPPFPFVQRWDPQQQYFAGDKNKRGGRSKRKQRNQGEFLEEDNQSSTKRRKYGRESLGYEADDDYYNESYAYQEETTGFEETVLNYDDEPQEMEEQPEQTPSQNVAGEDDMPPLPTDVSLLPPLNTGKAVVGMVVTWKQWLLSKATNWQPQVSSLTGVVTEVLDDSTFTVRLAKRDRNLDFNEKIYDDDGNRVYDKFELPGMDDEGEEAAEQGYRTLDLADMIEPRILQLATGVVEPSSPTTQDPSLKQEHAAPDASQHAGSEPPNDRVSPTPGDDELEGKEVDSQQMDLDAECGGDQSLIPETPAAPEAIDTSISEDRRHEISLLITDAGFRKDVDPSVTDNADLDLSSPSRQLEEMSHDATLLMSELSENQRGSSPALPSQATSNNVDSQPILLEPFHGFSDATSEPRDGQRVAYPSLDLPPSETASIHSGRQVDPDFSIELGNDSFHDLNDAATVSRSTLGRRSDDEPDQALDSGAESESGTSDSSLPSLSELWRSTSSSGSKSPSKRAVMAAIKARKPAVAPDLEYEAAMRRLDNSDGISEDDNKEHVSKLLAQKLVDKPIEKPTPRKLVYKKGTLKSSSAPHIKSERASLSPGRNVRASTSRTVRAGSSPFVVPEGSQVVSLVSSSPEPVLEEHYAEDSIDETYKERNLPAGSGWVKKSRALRGVSVPASSTARDATPKRFASSQSKQGADKRPSTALSSLLRTKKKALSNAL